MELVNVRGFGLNLSELQELRSSCVERKRWVAAHRAGLLVVDDEEPESEDDPRSGPGEQTKKNVLQHLKTLHGICHDLGWESAATKIDMTFGHLKSTSGAAECDWSSLEADLRNVADMVISDLCRAKFVKVMSDYYKHVNNDELISPEFNTKFSKAAWDIKEAGNCIAVDCGTAAVFHLMRAVEWGMRALCVDLGLLTTREKNVQVPIEYSQWKQILDQLHPEIEKKIETFAKGQPRQDAQEFYLGVYFDIKGFKDAFRNHVSHTRNTYSQKDADAILDHVRKFFILLGTRIAE